MYIYIYITKKTLLFLFHNTSEYFDSFVTPGYIYIYIYIYVCIYIYIYILSKLYPLSKLYFYANFVRIFLCSFIQNSLYPIC